ncbi:hypothetical protein [Alterinioella nitratireducens]|uniref:hypothetical protein n=1 Tax=Alterinioella nitratireducens TaxID=2735915 RepID=UPI004057EA37
MTFRILISSAIFDTRDCVASAKELALFEASTLARETGQPVTVKVYRVGSPMHDALGRDCTPAFYIGRAVATPAGVEWQVGVARRTASRRLAA